ncbi:MAG: ABC transporter permease [Deltaproteobacteria bacterium]|nr:ABC transporter permease [Deltaproteobacteria bacterium]
MSKASLGYAAKDALQSIRENPVTVLLSALTVGFSLAITAFFFVIIANMDSIVKSWGNRAHVIAYIKPGVRVDPDELVKAAKRLDGVKDALFVSEEEALKILKADMKGSEALLDGVSPGVLPASLEITFNPEAVTPERMAKVASAIKAVPAIEDVQYGADWVEKFSAFLRFIKIFASVLGVFLVMATIFVISNTIRLSVYTRKDEIEVMSYLGATQGFIKTPFLLEGVLSGAAGGVLALSIMALGRYVFSLYIPSSLAFVLDLSFSVYALLAVLALSGALLGGVGSLVSMGRFLKV